MDEHCILGGTTAATCTATAMVTVGGSPVAQTVTTMITGRNYHRFDVEITGGAEKTANAAATCTSAATSATTSSSTTSPLTTSAGARVNTKARAVWALTGVVGIICVLAM